LGPIKIKDGLFMGDQLAAKVTLKAYRTLNLSLAIKLHISLTLSPKRSPISMNASAFSISLSIGHKKKKMYVSSYLDFRQKEYCSFRNLFFCGVGDVGRRELFDSFPTW